MADNNNFAEKLYDGIGVNFSASEVLFNSETNHQNMVLFSNQVFGKVLMLDGVTQVTTKDEFIYHEMMSHVPILAHGNAKNILIIGGGDGGVAEEVLKHPHVASLTMVEIDASVVEFSRKYFSEINNNVFDDPRFKLVIADGSEFVVKDKYNYDVIIVDSTDPINAGEVLFTKEFYKNCSRLLGEEGILVTQNGVPFMQPDELKTTISYFKEIFVDAYCYLAAIPTYFGGYMSLGWATNQPKHRKRTLSEIITIYDTLDLQTNYYNPEVHVAAFSLPQYIKKLVV